MYVLTELNINNLILKLDKLGVKNKFIGLNGLKASKTRRNKPFFPKNPTCKIKRCSCSGKGNASM